ncbi:MAG TPA: GNAT family N-acetyltransferase [Chloroflexi bacterium]|nr:GNAT family N-acetyltransferase [Chloroflexota bacterium]
MDVVWKRDMIHLRRAVPTDEAGIARVAHEVWNQAILPPVCQAQITTPGAALWVAVEGNDVLGFASAFLTVDRRGKRRWEVDLLAVRPVHRGQHLGRRLVACICQAPQARTAALARAAIRVENVASQRAFESVGFATDRQVHELLLWTPQPGADAAHSIEPVTLLPVDTLTYRGLWIEGLTGEGITPEGQCQAVRVARSWAARERRLNVGALIPRCELPALAAELQSQASVHGTYYWFRLPPLDKPSI